MPGTRATTQCAHSPDTSKRLPAKSITRIQQSLSTLLYYSITVDPIMLVALSTLAYAQTKATAYTSLVVIQLLNYAATHPGSTICYHASDMVLCTHSATHEATSSSMTGQPIPPKHSLANQNSMDQFTTHAKLFAMSWSLPPKLKSPAYLSMARSDSVSPSTNSFNLILIIF